jgi:hypothetical protein
VLGMDEAEDCEAARGGGDLDSGVGEFRDIQHKNRRGMAFGTAEGSANFADEGQRVLKPLLLNADDEGGVLATQKSAHAADFGHRILFVQQALGERFNRIGIKNDGENQLGHVLHLFEVIYIKHKG